MDGNIFAAFAQGGTDREEEEDISEGELVGASKRATKALGAPKPRRVQIPPPELTESSNIDQGSMTSSKSKARSEEGKGVTMIMKAV